MIIPVVYSENQIIRDQSLPPGAFKARDVFMLVSRETGLRVTNFHPVTRDQLEQIHSKDFVNGVFDGKIENGFKTRSVSHLVAITYAVGNFLTSVNLINPDNDLQAVFSLTSGFHHSHYDSCYGYCTFNALILAATDFFRTYKRLVLILDGDAHYGDGCIDIISHLNLQEEMDYAYIGSLDKEYHRKVMDRIKEGPYGLVLYQAGADAYIHDNLGAGTLTKDQFEERDRNVFTACKEGKTPVVFNLAGGYGAPDYNHTLMLHYNTWKTANRVFNDWD